MRKELTERRSTAPSRGQLAMLGVAAAAIAAAVAPPAALADTVTWIPGTYYDETYTSGEPELDTLVISQSGGQTYFNISGQDNVSFSLPTSYIPSSLHVFPTYNDVIIPVGALSSESWSPSTYPYITLYSNDDIVIGNVIGGVNVTGGELVYALGSGPPPYSFSQTSPSPKGSSALPKAYGSVGMVVADFYPATQLTAGYTFPPSSNLNVNLPLYGPRESAAGFVGAFQDVEASAWTPGGGSNAPGGGSSGIRATSVAQLTYFVEFPGKPGQSVEVRVSGLTTSTPDVYFSSGDQTPGDVAGLSIATVSIFDVTNPLLEGNGLSSSSGGIYDPYDQYMSFIAGDVYEVNLEAQATINCAIAAVSCPYDYQSALVDPTFTVVGGGTVLESANLVAVPEPPTWMMLLLGLCGLGAAASLARKPQRSARVGLPAGGSAASRA
jgi:hypothetical protein